MNLADMTPQQLRDEIERLARINRENCERLLRRDDALSARMTIDELASRLAPITESTLESNEPDMVKVGTVLAALMGCIAGGPPIDHEALDALTMTAGLICAHRRGDHG